MKIYSSIDTCPIWNYWKVVSTNDYKYLVIDVSRSMPEETKKKYLLEAWRNIEEELIDLQLKDSSYVLELKNEARFYIKMIKASVGTALDKTLFQIASEKKEKENGESFKYGRSIAMLEKHLGFPVDDKKMTVSRYYTHWQLIKEHGTEKNR